MSLRPFFVYERSFSSDSVSEELHSLTQVSAWRGVASIALNWMIIVSMIVVAAIVDHPMVYLTAMVVIGARQHALLVLMHDAAHFRLFPNRAWNERLADWLCAYPHLVSTEAYRRDHLRHHRYLNSDQDPNWVAKIENAEWEFPKTHAGIAWLFLKDLCGAGLYRMLGFLIHYQRKLQAAESNENSPNRMRRAGRIIYYLVAMILVTSLHLWSYIFVLWLLPLFTIVPALLRLRVIAEHHGLEHENDMNHSRNYHANLVERFLFAPHNVWLHLDHHLFPAIPHYHLPRAHALLETIPAYHATAHQSRAIFAPFRESVLDDISDRSHHVP